MPYAQGQDFFAGSEKQAQAAKERNQAKADLEAAYYEEKRAAKKRKQAAEVRSES